MLANSKIGRQIQSKAFNPEYAFTAKTEQFSLGEVAAPIIVFGDLESAAVKRTLVEYFFGLYSTTLPSALLVMYTFLTGCPENERFPTELGWRRSATVIYLTDISRISQLVSNATALITGPTQSRAVEARDLHGGTRN